MVFYNIFSNPNEDQAATAQQVLDNATPEKGEYLNSLFESTLQLNAGNLLTTKQLLTKERTGKIITPQEANERFGLDGALVFDKEIDEGEAIGRQRIKLEEVENNWIIQKYQENRSSNLTDNVVTDFGFGMAVSMLDPVNAAATYIPVGGWLNKVKGFSALSPVKQALIAGATEGFVGNALVEPLTYAGAKDLQLEYGWMDSLINLGAGAFFGATIQVGSELLSPFGKKTLRTGTGTTPETNSLAHQTAISQMAQDKPVNVTPLLELDQLKAKGIDRVEQRRARRAEAKLEQEFEIEKTKINFETRKQELKNAYSESLFSKASEISQLPARDAFERLGFEVKTNAKGEPYVKLGAVTKNIADIQEASFGNFLENNPKLREKIINQKATIDAQTKPTEEFFRDLDGNKINTIDEVDGPDSVQRQLNEQENSFNQALLKSERALVEIENATNRKDANRIYDSILEELGDMTDETYLNRLNSTLIESDARLEKLELIQSTVAGDATPQQKAARLSEVLEMEAIDEDLLQGVFRGDFNAIEEAFEISEYVKGAKTQQQLEKEFLEAAKNATKKNSDYIKIDTTKIEEDFTKASGDASNEYLQDMSLEEARLNEISQRNPEVQEELKAMLAESDYEIELIKAKQNLIEEAKVCMTNGGGI